VLTEAQVQALERKKDDDIAHGEIETAHPGYLGSQGTFYVGTIKDVGPSISKHLSIPIQNELLRSYILQKRLSQPPSCSTTKFFHSLRSKKRVFYVF
jgi:hypothetical protein